MAKKKTPKQIDENCSQKTLFDHINAITMQKNPNYFSEITDGDKKTWSTYMINRFLSMNMDLCEIIAELDPYTIGIQLPNDIVYKLYSDILPKQKLYLKYIKSKSSIKYNTEVINILCKHFEISTRQAIEYLNIYYSSESNLLKLKSLIIAYGNFESDVIKMLKI